MTRKTNLQEVFYIERVSGDILQGLGWVKIDVEIAQRIDIPYLYTAPVVIPNSEPYCCPIQPDDKTPYYQLDYQDYYYIYPPTLTGKSKKLLLQNDGELIKLIVSRNLTIQAVREWVRIWASPEARLITPGGRSVTVAETGQSRTQAAFIYFIFNRDSNSIKIGRAKDVEQRLKSLQTSSPVPLELLKVIQLDSMKAAQNLERSLHVKFSHLRLMGEWFKAKQELMNYLENCESYNPEKLVSSTPKPYRSIPISEL